MQTEYQHLNQLHLSMILECLSFALQLANLLFKMQTITSSIIHRILIIIYSQSKKDFNYREKVSVMQFLQFSDKRTWK